MHKSMTFLLSGYKLLLWYNVLQDYYNKNFEEKILRKYFFFDIDGTLTSPLDSCIPRSTVNALRELQNKEGTLVLATGRLQCDAISLAHELGIDSVISDGGNGVTIHNQIICHESLPLVSCKKF
ncbi:HAD family phosphatase [Dialister pneumosintes]|uniref:HAD family phosphatase n=1 Tax=Dialister pneumosintes TaxID=39950 RepID=A0ABX9MDG8_9FIRM|nr:HAD family phosphatase [Dialister pneumosintes]